MMPTMSHPKPTMLSPMEPIQPKINQDNGGKNLHRRRPRSKKTQVPRQRPEDSNIDETIQQIIGEPRGHFTDSKYQSVKENDLTIIKFSVRPEPLEDYANQV